MQQLCLLLQDVEVQLQHVCDVSVLLPLSLLLCAADCYKP
jgi:hypothetical protein